jgi:hypothetical protein
MNLWRKEKARSKWRSRARMIDMRKTRVVLPPSETEKRVPTWVYRKLVKES